MFKRPPHLSAASAADFLHLQSASVEFRKASKNYGETSVLCEIDLTIAAGEVVAICGPSGSGKSTLIRLINQLETLSDGDIYIDGKPTRRLSSITLRRLRSRIGFVFQQFNLYAHLTAEQNITLSLTHVHGWKREEAHQQALALLARVGSPKKRSIIQRSFPAGSSSAWRLPERWHHPRKLFCLTNQRRLSTRR
ncbi:Glutamine transport ATP-binding protein GlnQ [Cedecea neteri]|uniref:Glutamine transport ATP-binding protein GlnQ n=1 Tax=Cedecea neteri TaxID=158822 RepID=A0A2X3JDV3_9ENTR|nr:Glutamine transport ATP-binding protein GlnQ [Cedecea neteri]